MKGNNNNMGSDPEVDICLGRRLLSHVSFLHQGLKVAGVTLRCRWFAGNFVLLTLG